MEELWERTQAMLRADVADFGAFGRDLRAMQRSLSGVDLARSDLALRLSLCLQGLADRRSGTADLAILLRQLIRAYHRRLLVPRALWQLISGRDMETGLRETAAEGGLVELFADPWAPTWLPGPAGIDELALRRHDRPAAGDGLLSAMTRSRWTTYQSMAQQAAVHASLFGPPGTTTLVMLPTGGGKSQCVLLPAWTESRGGSIRGGTTLVLVPTVSLALDQHRQALAFFEDAATPEFKPHCWTSGTGPDERSTIRRGLRAGTLPLLFLSPEALLGSELSTICLDAARQGMLRRLVVDEAHLVATWGAGFRSEFQFLAAYRRQLLAASAGQLHTVLLSATISDRVEQLLAGLFAEEGRLSIVRASRLRPEIGYWFTVAATREQREARVVEALRHLPRPAILYVTQPDDAAAWVHRLREAGFERLASYSGATAHDERLQIQREWSQSQRDIMVATSAFGLGVDQRDVRTVIHACMPENIDRFYQEVGRAGRDGCSAISLVCAAPGDEQLAFELTSSARITTGRALDRWRGMRATARMAGEAGDLMLVDTDAVPPLEPEMARSQRNREWNEHVLLLMQRTGLLSITDSRAETVLPAGGAGGSTPAMAPAASMDQQPASMEIRILNPTAVSDDETFVALVERSRNQEVVDVRAGLQQLRYLVARYAAPDAEGCIAHDLARLYPDTALACGGCPICRREGRQPYAEPLRLSADIVSGQASALYLSADLLRLTGPHQMLHLIRENSADAAELQKVLVALVGKGIQQVVLPADLTDRAGWTADLARALAVHRKIPHRVVALSPKGELREQVLYPLPTAAVYPADTRAADCLHRALSTSLPHDIPRVNIVQAGLYIASEHGRLVDRVDGMVTSMGRLLESSDEPAFALF